MFVFDGNAHTLFSVNIRVLQFLSLHPQTFLLCLMNGMRVVLPLIFLSVLERYTDTSKMSTCIFSLTPCMLCLLKDNSHVYNLLNSGLER